MKVMMGMGMMYLPLMASLLFVIGTFVMHMKVRSTASLMLFLGAASPLVLTVIPLRNQIEWLLLLGLIGPLLQVAGIIGLARAWPQTPKPAAP